MFVGFAVEINMVYVSAGPLQVETRSWWRCGTTRRARWPMWASATAAASPASRSPPTTGAWWAPVPTGPCSGGGTPIPPLPRVPADARRAEFKKKTWPYDLWPTYLTFDLDPAQSQYTPVLTPNNSQELMNTEHPLSAIIEQMFHSFMKINGYNFDCAILTEVCITSYILLVEGNCIFLVVFAIL